MDLEGWIQGLIHLSEISHGVVKDIREYIKVWEEVTAKIINFEPTKKRIGLSLKALQEAPKGTPTTKKITKSIKTDWEEEKIDAEVADSKKQEIKKEQVKKEAIEKKVEAKKEAVEKKVERI
jgi:predicted RNA-binding protein with RPS1 domain